MTGSVVILLRADMVVFLVASMLELGLSLTFSQVMAPFRDVRLVLRSLVANFVIVPLLALGIAKVARLEPPFAMGLLLLGLTPGAPFIPKIVQLAHGNLAFSVALMVLLMVGTVAWLPLVLPYVAVGAEVKAWRLAQPLLLVLLLPLLVGLFARARLPGLPTWLRPALTVLSNVCGLSLLALIVALNFKNVVGIFGTRAVLASAAFIVLAALSGWWLGGADRGICSALGVGTALRNVATALLVASQNFKDSRISVMIIATALISLFIMVPGAIGFGRRTLALNSLRSSPRAAP